MTNRLTATLGAALRPSKRSPSPEQNNPDFADEDDYPVDSEQHPAARRRVLRPRRRRRGGGPRRLRPLLRQDALRDHRRPLQRRRLLRLVHRELPGLGGGSRPAQRAASRPIRSWSTVRCSTARCSNQLFPPGSALRNTGNVTLDNPNRGIPQSDQLSVGYERQLGAHDVGRAPTTCTCSAATCS